MTTKVQCTNCDNDAAYTNSDKGITPVNYCNDCLPAWLRDRADLGHFPLVEKIEAPKAAAKKPSVDVTPEVTPEDASN